MHFDTSNVNTAVVNKLEKAVFIDEFLRYYVELDANVFLAVKGCAQVEISKIGRKKPCLWAQADTIDYEFDKFQQTRFGAAVTRVIDGVVSNGDACTLRFFLHWTLLADYSCVRDVRLAIVGNIVIHDGLECVGSVEPSAGWILWVDPNALTQSSQLIVK